MLLFMSFCSKVRVFVGKTWLVGLDLTRRLYNKLGTSLRTCQWIMDEAMDLFGNILMFVRRLLLFR